MTGMLAALGAAAALVVALRGSQPPAPPPTPVATVERVAGGGRRVSPEEGTSLVLATGDVLVAGTVLETGQGRTALRAGRVSLRVDRDTRVRLVGGHTLELDRGALYVDSDSGSRDGTLEVRTPEGVVRDVGTRFEVRAGPGRLRVRVRDGEVILEHGGSSDRAGPGTELRLEGGRLTRRAVSPVDDGWAWAASVAPGFELEGRRLSDFLDWYTRETGRAWRLAPGLQGKVESVLHGSVADLTPDEAREVVLPTCGLGSRIEGETLHVVSARGEGRD
jgi:ferric-dicitrate binding protein FerR (iron transport regulator)